MKIEIGQYFYDREYHSYGINYIIKQRTSDGDVDTGESFMDDSKSAIKRVYELNGWEYHGRK